MNSEKLYLSIGKKIASLRKQKGLSQADLANLIGLRPSSISNIERGSQRIRVHKIFEISEQLGVNIVELLPIDVDPVTEAIHRGTQKIKK